MKIGFIGMGIMGKPMALNLVKAGYDVTVSNRTMSKCTPLVEAGAKAGTYIEAAKSCDVIITMLPDAAQVREVILGEAGIGRHMLPHSTLIDMTSINPVDSRAIASSLREYDVEMLDAPVSGGEPKAVDGTLSIMVGGKQELFDRYKEMLLAMGSSVVRCGDVGAGNTAKLANQIIVACNIQALAEALTLAQRAGVDPQLVFEAIRGGLAGSTVMNAKAPMMISGDDKPGFKIDLHIKDLKNAIGCAHFIGAPIPMTAEVMEAFRWVQANGGGNKDHSALIQFYEHLTGCRLSSASGGISDISG